MKRFDKRYVFYHLLADFFACLFILLVFFGEAVLDEEGEATDFSVVIPYLIAGFAVLYAGFIVYRILYVRLSGYELAEGEIRCRRGVLFRKKSLLEYKKINAVNKRQNIIQKLFGICVITVDSGSANTAHTAEIVIIESDDVAEEIVARLKCAEGGAPAVEDTLPEEEASEASAYKFKSDKKWLYSAINIVSAALSVLLVGIFSATVFTAGAGILRAEWASDFAKTAVTALVIILLSALAVSVVSFIGSIVNSFVGFYNFRVCRVGSSVDISYGLLVLHHNTFSYDRIRAVKIKQGLIKRLFGYAEIQLEVIGYGGEAESGGGSGEVGILVPFCKLLEAEKILGEILPDYTPAPRSGTARALFPFISWVYLFVCSAFALAAGITLADMAILGAPSVAFAIVGLVMGSALLATLLVILASAALNYKTSGISVSGEKITVYSGGLFKCITVLPTSALSSVEEVSTPRRKRRGISSYVLHLRARSTTNEVRVEMQDSSAFEELISAMKY